MHTLITAHEQEFSQGVEHLKQELSGLRTGRASATLIENIMVDVYGSMTPLKGVASISVPDARSLVISPWDPSVIKSIETAISNANLSVNPVNEGTTIRIIFPEMTEESRNAMVKVMNAKLETARVGLRSIRDSIKESILKAEKNKEITEDDRYELLEQLDLITKDYTKKMQDIGDKKEQEIITI
ncbi:MAG: ribosome recycling factor [bacterium]|nr:ribosome recycling factor [bacterium]